MNRTGRAGVAAAAAVAVLAAARPHPRPARAPGAAPGGPSPGPVAARFVVAVGDVDRAHPHGQLGVLAALAAPRLLAALAVAPALPAAQLAAGARQRVTVADVAVSGRADGSAAVSVTARLTLLVPGHPAGSVAVGYPLVLRRVRGRWQVVGVAS